MKDGACLPFCEEGDGEDCKTADHDGAGEENLTDKSLNIPLEVADSLEEKCLEMEEEYLNCSHDSD